MHIRKGLPQFEGSSTLLVVMGTHHGIIYYALDGDVELLEEVRIDTPTYSDKEGLFMRAGNGMMYSVGAVLESKEKTAVGKFSRELAAMIEEIAKYKEIEKICLFAAPEMKSFIKKDWKAGIAEKIACWFDGNYTALTPMKLVAMYQEEEDGKREKKPVGDAKKLLDKARRR